MTLEFDEDKTDDEDSFLMWVEKYRPQNLREVVNQKEIVARLEALVKKPQEMPHLLFAGPPGTGKTTVSLCVAREIMGGAWRDYTLELNASNERGIDTVRQRIKNFASYVDRAEGIPFRIILLDESDNMCLDPETRVLVGDFQAKKLQKVTMQELYEEYGEEEFDLPTYDSRSGRPENDRGRIVPSGTAELFEIMFEDGRKIFASQEHPFFQITGTHVSLVRTRDLIPGVSLVADFANRFLTCYSCKNIFYRHHPFDVYERYFCSSTCRNIFFGSLSRFRTPEEKRAISAKAISAIRTKGIFGSESYRAERADIGRRLFQEGRLKIRKFEFKKGEGAWTGKKLSEEHREAIGRGVRLRLKKSPEIREKQRIAVSKALAAPNGKYRKLVESGFFKELSPRAYLASVEYWKKNRFRSKLESQMASLLASWKIPFKRETVVLHNSKNHPYPLAIDFVLDERIALFVHGCWWHVCPTCKVEPKYEKQKLNMVKDNNHTNLLEQMGYKVVIVWEHELKSDLTVKESVLPRIFETVGVAGMGLPKIKHSKVVSVTSIGMRPVLNISVTKNKNFFLGNGILTHNTNDAQTALRRIMEESHKTTRFILTANYSSNIIEPIQSRCAVFRFSRLSQEDVVKYLESICKKEGMSFTKSALALIYENSEGDMRSSLNMLQAASSLGDINSENAKKVTGLSGKAKVGEAIELALDGDFSSARMKMIELLQVNGISEHDFIKYANDYISKSDFSTSYEALEATAEADYRLLVGANPEIQLSAYLAQLAQIGKHSKN